MTTTQWIAIASLATVIVSAVAILVGLKSVRDQLRITIFLEYTERYAKIMHDMPYQAREPGSGYRLDSQPNDERYRVLAVFREYLNLCSEENCSTNVGGSIILHGTFGNMTCKMSPASLVSVKPGRSCPQSMMGIRIFRIS